MSEHANTPLSNELDPVEPLEETPEQPQDSEWDEEPAGPGLIARMLAEAGGTFILVFMGVGAALFSGVMGWDLTGVAFGFALGVIIAAVVFGRISGAHLNPAVTIGLSLAGRFPARDIAPYVISQVIGATLASGFFAFLISTNELYDQVGTTRKFIGTASNGFGEHSPTQFDWLPAGIVEVLIAAVLVAVVLSVTSVLNKNGAIAAPYAIGLTVGFLVMVAIPFTNGALNPARATGTALLSEPWALQQLWLFWVAPIIGAAISGLLFRAFGPSEDLLGYGKETEDTVYLED